MLRHRFVLFPLVALPWLAGCPLPGGDTGEPPDDFSDCHADEGAAYDLGGLEPSEPAVVVDGDVLSITVGYGGGCEEHLWALCWPDGSFMESDPVQARLELWHGGEPDPCDAYLSETLTFDLTPMRDAWHASYGAGPGTMILLLDDESATYTFE